jgi:hypothetical protein
MQDNSKMPPIVKAILVAVITFLALRVFVAAFIAGGPPGADRAFFLWLFTFPLWGLVPLLAGGLTWTLARKE